MDWLADAGLGLAYLRLRLDRTTQRRIDAGARGFPVQGSEEFEPLGFSDEMPRERGESVHVDALQGLLGREVGHRSCSQYSCRPAFRPSGSIGEPVTSKPSSSAV